jgi:hypothetical protein
MVSPQQRSDVVQAFHNDPALKQEFISRLSGHAQAGELLNAASSWKDGKGSPVACMVHDTNLIVWQGQTGIPKAVGNALDTAAALFDRPAKAAQFTLEWMEAIAVGQDLCGVAPGLIIWLLSDAEHGLRRWTMEARVGEAIDRVVGLHRRAASGNVPDESEWQQVRAAAMAATDGCEGVENAIAACTEAAAWNTASASTAVSDTVRVWTNLVAVRRQGQFGRSFALDGEIKAWIAQLADDANRAGRPAPNISEQDLCQNHPAVVALKRLQTEQAGKYLREDKELVPGVLLALTRKCAGAANSN